MSLLAQSSGASTRDVPLVGPALEGKGYAETKEGAPVSLEPYESYQNNARAKQLPTNDQKNRGARNGRSCAAKRAAHRSAALPSGGRVTRDLLDSDPSNQAKNPGAFIDKSEWLTTKEAAIQLRKFLPSGEPSANAVHKLVANGSLRRRKFAGRLYFRKKEIDFLIESSVV